MGKSRDAMGKQPDDEALYYVQDSRQYVGNSIGIDGGGYTCDINKAGTYDGARVRSMRDTDVPWPVGVVLEASSLHVDAQHLPPRNTTGSR